jgi:hypothetical protein
VSGRKNRITRAAFKTLVSPFSIVSISKQNKKINGKIVLWKETQVLTHNNRNKADISGS